MLSDRDRTRLLLDAPKDQLRVIDNILLGRNLPTQTSPQRSMKTFSISEAAKKLNLCRKSVYKLIRTGELKTIPFGNRVRISDFAIEDYIMVGTR